MQICFCVRQITRGLHIKVNDFNPLKPFWSQRLILFFYPVLHEPATSTNPAHCPILIFLCSSTLSYSFFVLNYPHFHASWLSFLFSFLICSSLSLVVHSLFSTFRASPSLSLIPALLLLLFHSYSTPISCSPCLPFPALLSPLLPPLCVFLYKFT